MRPHYAKSVPRYGVLCRHQNESVSFVFQGSAYCGRRKQIPISKLRFIAYPKKRKKKDEDSRREGGISIDQ